MSRRAGAIASLVVPWLLVACGAGAPDPIDIPPQDAQATATPVGDAGPEQPPVSGKAPETPKPSGWRMAGGAHAYHPTVLNPALAYEASCESGKADLQSFGDACGTKGRIAVEYDGSHTMMAPDAPCALVRVLSKSSKGAPGAPPGFDGTALAACVVGDELLASGTCQMCRVPDVGWSFHGKISEMTSEQQKAIFAKLDLEGSVPTSAKAWLAAIERAKPPAAN